MILKKGKSDNMETKTVLFELRKKQGLSQDEMAARLFVTRQAVSRWEQGETVPNVDTLKLISKEFGISVDELLGYKPPNSFSDVYLKIKTLFEIFFRRGGMQLQVNVCDAETLKKAQANPKEYASLIVRVGGYSDYFVNISKALQDEIIIRSAQRV